MLKLEDAKKNHLLHALGSLMKAKIEQSVDGQFTPEETARRRDDLIRRALRTPPTPLKELKKKRNPKTGAQPLKRGDA
jgi:hypothetical protein